ncbi:MAG TPA: hypothetical protein VMG12_19785 [Polyangiaceae bacterium]|nr:hypothetical protein [Polyangiaceae bacterium]
MNTTSTCNCETEPRAKPTNERPRYYARQLVTPEDLTLDQDYFRDRLRRHNLFLHGWGVVCGARVRNATTPAQQDGQAAPWLVIVKRGYILGPYGDEIWIEKDVCFDVRTKCTTSSQTPGDDGGCAEAQPAPEQNVQKFIAVRYKENKSRLVRVPLGGCGCETNACEYTRYADGYEICVIDECPTPPPEVMPTLNDLQSGEPPDCPPPATSPWVVLASFTVTTEGNVTITQCVQCRRQVLGFGKFWWSCATSEDNQGGDRNVGQGDR